MIGIISPHLFSIEGTPSPNIGDQIIYRYLFKEIKALFPKEVFYDFPLHANLNQYHKFLLAKCDLIFVTGSNFLTPRFFSQRKALVSVYEMGFKDNVIFMGGGWSGGEAHELDTQSIKFYKRIMHKSYAHSVRDSLTYKKLSVIGLPVVNTSCPTMWALPSKKYNLSKPLSNCLFTLTDYSINIDDDQSFLKLILGRFNRLYYFPQGKYDIEYLTSLECYKNNLDRFVLMDRSLEALNDYIKTEDFTYIGTRLHCGIHVLNNDKEALILEVDNRAKFISKDTNLPVSKRGDTAFINNWLDGEDVFGAFSLPKSWNAWKEGFRN